jgi:serine/threonine protein kinase
VTATGARAPSGDDGAPHEGGRPRERTTLDRLLVEGGPVPAERAASLLRPLARDLDRLHARGALHGAVRPWNVAVGPDGAARLGAPVPGRAARPEGAASAGRDADYLSPQLLAGEPPRPSDDLYALGAIAYELLVGTPPFERAASGSHGAATGADAPTPNGTARGHAAGPSRARRLVPPTERRPDLPAEVERVLLAQLSASPAGRFATGLDLVRELERAASAASHPRDARRLDRLPPHANAIPTVRRVPSGPGARRLALAEMQEGVGPAREAARPRRVRRNDYPEVDLPGRVVAVILLVLCSVYLLPLYYMLVGVR